MVMFWHRRTSIGCYYILVRVLVRGSEKTIIFCSSCPLIMALFDDTTFRHPCPWTPGQATISRQFGCTDMRKDIEAHAKWLS